MAVKTSSLLFRILLLLVVIFVLVSLAEAGRGGGGRGGGGRGGGGRGRGSGRGRSTSRSRSTSSSKRKGFLGSNTATKAAIAAGVIYGASSWRRRRLYYSNPNRVPTACYNDRYRTNVYGNVSYLGRFLCPGDGDEDGDEYCCGDEGQQTCCSFFEDSGRIAGLIIGIIVAFIVVGVCVFCCCKRKIKGGMTPAQSIRSRFSKRSGQGHEMAAVPLNQPPPPLIKDPTPGVYPAATTYQPYPQPATAQPMVPPPAYDTTGPAPYDPNNQGSDMSKPPLPAGDMSGPGYPPGGSYPVQPDAPPYPGAYPSGQYTAPPYGVQPYPGENPSPQPYPASPMGFDSQDAVPYPLKPPTQ
ncbi:uncharacterized protein LOC117317811 isoform X3 [Pecten maximus]|uniref:uncharacterized protein LOC117317811 isoform X3 n=1 Tax=Pecten maximus TaxID=6579 RepID=UPI001459116F|nr:uncharacterized protein LOC117317811 isoform X3 [Pecten maximus]